MRSAFPSATSPSAARPVLSGWWPAAALDATGVLVFVTIGRASHDEAGAVAGLARTAWPFLAGLALGWVAIRAWRRPAALLPIGIVVWLVTVVGGMALRVFSGQGTAPPFVIVSLIFLGAVLLGWRALWYLTMPRSRNAAPATHDQGP